MTAATAAEHLPVWRRIFGDDAGYVGLLALSAQGDAHPAFLAYPKDAARALEWLAVEDRRGWNTYSCAHLLTGMKRDGEHAAAVRALWADLDGAPLPTGDLAPSVVLETSPGHFHGWWCLAGAIEPELAERLNQRLAAAIGADPSGADLTQVLRVAQTHNHKPERGRPLVTLLTTDGPTYDPATLDRLLPRLPEKQPRRTTTPATETGGRPGDDFNVRASWADVLEPAGWGFVYEHGGESYWCRPGKRGAVSATTGYQGADILHMFTSSTEFEPKGNYTKFAAHALLKYGGDFTTAARSLAALGYGEQHRNGAAPTSPTLSPTASPTASPAEPAASPTSSPTSSPMSSPAEPAASPTASPAEPAASPAAAASGAGTVALGEAISSSERFARDKGDRLYVYRAGAFRADGDRTVARRVTALLAAAGLPEKWSTHRQSEVVAYLCQSAPELPDVPPASVINVRNGLIYTGAAGRHELRPHNPDVLTCVQLPVDYDPAADCPATRQFEREVFPADALDVAAQIDAWLLQPHTRIRKALLLQGPTGTGKSIWLRQRIAFLGRENVSTASLNRLEGDRFTVASLYGMLANVGADLPSAALAGTSVFKLITGHDPLAAERKFAQAFSFEPFCKLLFSSNALPHSPESDDAFFRRWLVLPFVNQFTEDAAKGAALDAALSDPRELSGLLNRALAALPRVLASGITETASMREALDEFRAITDPFAVWLDRNTIIDPDGFILRDELRDAYNAGRRAAGAAPVSTQAITAGLRQHRPPVTLARPRQDGIRPWVWLGISLCPRNERNGPNGPKGPKNSLYIHLSRKEGKDGGNEGGEKRGTSKENLGPFGPLGPDGGVFTLSADAADTGVCADCGQPTAAPQWVRCADCLKRVEAKTPAAAKVGST